MLSTQDPPRIHEAASTSLFEEVQARRRIITKGIIHGFRELLPRVYILTEDNYL